MASIEQCASLMADRFWDDPGIQAQMRGVKDARRLFGLQCLGQLRAYQRFGLLACYEGGPSFVVGYRSDELDMMAFALAAQECSQEFIETCTPDDLAAMQASIPPVAAISDPVWYGRHFEGPVFDLQIIVVEPALKGTGVFRAMVDPLLHECEATAMPAVLQTHKPSNVPLYEHFGFKTLEAPHSDDLALTCYCMARAEGF